MSSSLGKLVGPGFWIIPSLIQIVVVEMIGAAILGGVIVARILDHFGLCGHQPIAPLSWWLLVWFAVGAFFIWLTLRDIWRPGVTEERYSPVRKIGPVMMTLHNDPAGYRYKFLGSHPAYVLMDMVAALPPLAVIIYSWGDDPARNPTMQVYRWWLIVWAVVPAARLFCWYGLRRGPEVVTAMIGTEKSGAAGGDRGQFEWRHFWSGPLSFWLIALFFAAPALVLGIYKSRQEDKGVPELNAATIHKIYGARYDPNAPETISPNHDDERFRVRGAVRGEVRHWPGGGGDKVDGVGFVVALEDGPEVVVFADERNMKAIERAISRQDRGSFTCVVRTLYDGGKEISPHYKHFYNWSETDLRPVPEEAKRFTDTGRRILTYYVDP
jgi:hypothetical protein